ncbi:MAG: DUF4338 domain-containing protein [Desulfurivibrionaceae bacterium]|nr:DUF4338 domain-containing protein [Desulfurivibrionaceae bacterium]
MTLLRQFTPHLPSEPLRKTLGIISRYKERELVENLRQEADIVLESHVAWRLDLAAILLVLADLASIGWKFKAVGNTIYMVVESNAKENHLESKAAVRKALGEARGQQLAENGTKAFLASMHRPRMVSGGETVTIDSLIDDGSTLVEAIRQNIEGDLRKVIDPYIQFVDEKTTCEFTGFKLQDIWRYFRHTWAIEYRSTPGRTISFIIRNRARDKHPVIGIVSLANAVMQLRGRDNYIGWVPEGIIKRIATNPEFWKEFKQTTLNCLKEAREAIRSADLCREIGEDLSPTEIIKRLEGLSLMAQERRNADLADIYQEAQGNNIGTAANRLTSSKKSKGVDWVALSETPLFRRKRAATLAEILFAEYHLTNSTDDGNEVLALLSKGLVGNRHSSSTVNADFERAFKIAVREVKKAGVGTRIMDVNVCGSSPVYREILGGKLAALSLFTEEIQNAYTKKYGKAASEIASGMAGRPIVKPSRIALLTTTSLYGVGSSQYNRVRMKYGNGVTEWKRIGETEGYGTVHMTRKTIDIVREVSIARSKRRNVNNQFGEGTSPLMRQLREGFSFLGFDSDAVLQHSQKRIVYLLELYPGACDDLVLNKDCHPKAPSMEEVSQLWIDRWLTMRVKNEEVLGRLSAYTPNSVKNELLSAIVEKQASII